MSSTNYHLATSDALNLVRRKATAPWYVTGKDSHSRSVNQMLAEPGDASPFFGLEVRD
jgi:hypothetical protein